ncbi:MAG: hypothetical protein ACTHJ0_16330 [Flavipsychrobacter sp.]
MNIEFGVGIMDVGYAIVCGPIESRMPKFFENKYYGKGCKFIGYRIVCFRDDFKQPLPSIKYIPKLKKVECYIELDYKTVNDIHYKKTFMQYVKNVFQNEAQNFEDLDIPDFDLDKYVADLGTFFDEYNNRFDDNEEIEEPNWV